MRLDFIGLIILVLASECVCAGVVLCVLHSDQRPTHPNPSTQTHPPKPIHPLTHPNPPNQTHPTNTHPPNTHPPTHTQPHPPAAVLAIQGAISPNLAGLCLVYALDLTRFLKHGTAMASKTESDLNRWVWVCGVLWVWFVWCGL